MRKITLSALGIFAGILSIFSQEKTDSTTFKSKKLSLEEINIVSSYYHQDGNNSAITGGIGTEKLSDYANFINIKLNKYNKKELKHSIDLEIGIDHFTSASSDNVSPNTGTNASTSSVDAKDTRIYPAINWQVENEKKGTTFGTGLSVSSEFDYLSFGANFIYGKKFNQNNSEISGKVQVYIDQLKLVYPAELIPISAASSNGGHDDDDDKYISNFEEEEGKSEGNYPTRLRNSFSNSITFAQIINKNIQVAFTADAVYQNGYLGLPFHRVYFNDNSVHKENLPDTRMKIPLGFRANYFIGDKVILRSFYRYYHDDWGLTAHTLELETPVKVTPFFSITPFYRYYKQTAVDYFAPYKSHTSADQYYTSNYDLSAFNSNFYGAGIRLTPPKGVFGIQRLSMLELRYGHYTRTNGLKSDIVSMNLKFK